MWLATGKPSQVYIEKVIRIFQKLPQWLLDIVLVPISHHFLRNYRLTLHHVLHLKTFHTRSIGWALFGVNFKPLQEIEAVMGGGRIFDTGPFSRDCGTGNLLFCVKYVRGLGYPQIFFWKYYVNWFHVPRCSDLEWEYGRQENMHGVRTSCLYCAT